MLGLLELLNFSFPETHMDPKAVPKPDPAELALRQAAKVRAIAELSRMQDEIRTRVEAARVHARDAGIYFDVMDALPDDVGDDLRDRWQSSNC